MPEVVTDIRTVLLTQMQKKLQFVQVCNWICAKIKSLKYLIKIFIFPGINACEKLLNISNAHLHKWYAILVGVYGEFLPIAEKIKNGYRFKEHVMKALEISPNDADLHHLLGRFKYEVANLSWIERKVYILWFNSIIIK